MGGVGGGCLRRAEYACGSSRGHACESSRDHACGSSRSHVRSRALFGGAAACAVRHDAGSLGKVERDGTVSDSGRGEWEWNFANAVCGSGEARRHSADG
jgi:hypothetical protein